MRLRREARQARALGDSARLTQPCHTGRAGAGELVAMQDWSLVNEADMGLREEEVGLLRRLSPV